MRGLLDPMMEAASKEKELLKELTRMAAKLRALDENPDQDLPAEVAGDIRGTRSSSLPPPAHTLSACVS